MAHAATRPKTKWSDDAFLDTLRDSSDTLANTCAHDLPRDQSLAFLFTKMRTDAQLPEETEFPAAFAKFLRAARESLELNDLTAEEQAKLKRGQQVFMTNALPTALILLSKSLQEGYQAPRLAKVLMMSGALDTQTYRRVLGVLQMVLKVVTPGSFEPKLKSSVLPSSESGLEAIKVRLMHAGLRGIAKEKFPDFTRQHGGEPISMEDMLATLMAFSSLVMDGFDILKIKVSADDQEAYHFIWRVYARLMGIHPKDKPTSWEYIPETLADAREFYDAYKRRHYAPLEQNPTGAALADSNLKMLARRMPPLAARIYMGELIGDDACKALGIRRVPLLFIWKAVLLNFPRAWIALWRVLDRRTGGKARHEELTQLVLQKLVVMQYNAGIPSYRVPRDVLEIKGVVEGTQPGLNFGSDQFRREVFPVELSDIANRREAVGLDAEPLKAAGAPSAERGLVGLALSGGGIRSATFALGAVQALARRGSLKMVDYLSTVSGGGYTGSALSSLLNDPDAGLDGKAFPLNFETGTVEPPALRHLRSGSNYLTGGGAMDKVRLPAILLRGLLLNIALILPYIMLIAVATAWVFPVVHEGGLIRVSFWFALVALLGVIAWHPVASWWNGRSHTWEQRNRGENLLALVLLLFAISVAISLLSGPVSSAIASGWMRVKSVLLDEIRSPVDGGDIWKWALLAAVLFAAVRASKVAESLKKRSSRAFVYALGLTAPVAAFAVYLLLLVIFARSPYLEIDRADVLTAASEAVPPVIDDSAFVEELKANGLDVDESSRVTVDSTLGTEPFQWTIHAGAYHAYRITESDSMLRMGGVEFGRGIARIGDPADTAAVKMRVNAVELTDQLLDILDSLSMPYIEHRVIRNHAMLIRLRALGVNVDSNTTVALGKTPDTWTIGNYGLAFSSRGLILANADLGAKAALRRFVDDTTGGRVLWNAMQTRGASLDGLVSVMHYAKDTSWIVRSGDVEEYAVRREGGRYALRAQGGSRWRQWLARFGAMDMIDRTATFLNLGGLQEEYLHVKGVEFLTQRQDWLFLLTTLLLVAIGWLVLNVNITSPHGYWRDRLSRVFLIRARWFGRPVANDALKLSEMGTLNAAVPYHILNTSLNLASSRVEDLPGRGSDFFMFSRRYTGSYATGYCKTDAIEKSDRHINLGTAMAISSAAVAPNSGTVTVKPLVPMLTVLNVRQDYWAPNPWYVQASSLVRRLMAGALTPGPLYLFREAFGLLHARGPFVNLSDGGHIENLGVYELLRRRCQVIVAADAEHDPAMSCASLATLIRYARIDLGIEIDIDTNPLNLDSFGLTHRHWTLGTIRYGATEIGYLLYVKSSVTGDEAPYVKDYRRANPDFPQETTADQFFDEAQFESYRALGYHAMNGALKAAAEIDAGDGGHGSREGLAAVRAALGLGRARFTGQTTVMP